MRKNQRQALDALFSGNNLNLPSLIVNQTGARCPECDDWHPTLYSYGHHFPLLILVKDCVAYLNTGKYSATTSSQQSGCALYLHYEGYRDTGETITHHGHTFTVYQLTEPESWPGNTHFSENYARPAHHQKEG